MIRWQNLSASSQNYIIKYGVCYSQNGWGSSRWVLELKTIVPNLLKSVLYQGAKKVSFTAFHSGKLLLVCTKSLLSSQKIYLMSSIDYSSSVIWISQKTSLAVKLRTGFTSPIAKSTSPGLSDMTLFAHCVLASCSFKEYIFKVVQF